MTKTKVNIRLAPFTSAMAKSCATLIQLSILRTHSRFYTDDQMRSLTFGYTADQLITKSEERKMIVAFYGPIVVGIGSSMENQIKAIYVHPDHFRLGVGSMILSVLEEDLRKNRYPSVTLAASLNSKPFYLKFGYTVQKRTK